MRKGICCRRGSRFRRRYKMPLTGVSAGESAQRIVMLNAKRPPTGPLRHGRLTEFLRRDLFSIQRFGNQMTKAEWQTCSDPTVMLEFVSECDAETEFLRFAHGCCRRI